VVLSGCGDNSSVPEPNRTTRRTPSAGPTRTSRTPSPTAPALPTVATWHPDPSDFSPLGKLTAVRRIEGAGNSSDQALQVIDAQYGGLLADSVSVLVVTQAWRRRGQGVLDGGHTYDVRVSRTASDWRVTAIHPSEPGRPAARLTGAARHVLASRRISLPPAGEGDILSGQVHDSVLEAMLTMSATFRIHVSVVRSGHPIYVFGTDRLSDHPQGRAFDTWAIDGRSVVSARTPRTLVEDYMHAAAEAGSYNVGGPYLLGAAPQWFSDDTHHDHVHAGFAT
jgi:hypothetical protein